MFRSLTTAAFALVSLAPAAAKTSEKESMVVHVVEPGDSLWKIAEDNGCTLDQLRKVNAIANDDLLRVGKELRIPVCAKGPAPKRETAGYRVAPGDTLSRIAHRHDTTVQELMQLNDLDDSVIVVGQRLIVPGQGPTVRVVPGQSVGRPFRGSLADAVRLRPGRGYHLRRPERSYAARHVVDHTSSVLAEVRARHPKLHVIAVGDLSAKEGGWVSGHRSHQSGRDVDVGLCFKKRPRQYPDEFAVGTEDNLDLDATWTMIRAFAETADQPGGAEMIFLDYDVQGLVYDHARKRGVPRRVLDEVLQYPHGRWARRGLVRHLRAHDDHVHVRFRCPKGDETCQ